MDELHNEEEMEAVVGKFLQKLTDSGYKNSHRKEIIRSGCINFCRRQIEDRTGGKKLYRTETQMKEARKAKKHSNQYWFKATRGGKDLTPRKDRPFEVQECERNRRRQNRVDRNQVQVDIDLPKEESREENREKVGSTSEKETKVKEVEAVFFCTFNT